MLQSMVLELSAREEQLRQLLGRLAASLLNAMVEYERAMERSRIAAAGFQSLLSSQDI